MKSEKILVNKSLSEKESSKSADLGSRLGSTFISCPLPDPYTL